MNGGYILIDATGLDLTKGKTPQTINGLYNRVYRAMAWNKPMYCCNAIWGTGKPITPIQIFAIDFEDYIICTASTLQVIIAPDDTVTINNMAGD